MKNTIIKVLSVVMAIVTLMTTVLVVSASAADECKHENYEQYGDPVAATCTEWGFTLYQCSDCKKHYKTEFNTLEKPHNLTKGFEWIIKEEVAGTCVAEAYNVIVCPVCEEETTEVAGPKGDHAWGDWVGTDSACTTAGNKTRTCTVCAKTETKTNDATGHKWVAQEDQMIEPKCVDYCEAFGLEAKDALGYMPYACADCGATRTIEIEPTAEHDYIEMDAEVDTCTTVGHAKGSFCKWCRKGETTKDQNTVVNTKKHAWKDDYTKEYKSASCEADGFKTQKCSVCNETKVVVTEKTGHEWNENDMEHTEYKAPTCKKYGYKLYGCSKCGTVFQNEVLEPTGCDFDVEPIKTPATCTEAGGLKYICKNEGCDNGRDSDGDGVLEPNYKLEEDANAPATGHVKKNDEGKTVSAIVDVPAKPATCGTNQETGKAEGEDGNKAGKQCSVCEMWIEGGETIPALKCQFIIETCTVAGLKNVRCYKCGDYQIVDGEPQAAIEATVAADAATTHVWKDAEVTPATCTTMGLRKQVCEFCGDATRELPVSMLDHTPGEEPEVVGAVCLEGGLTVTVYCKDCYATISVTKTPYDPNGHDFAPGERNNAATCETAGVYHQICTACGYVVLQNVSALGHDYKKTAKVEPTCTNTGMTEYSQCTRCEAYKDNKAPEVIPVLGHDDQKDASIIAGYAPTCTTEGLKAGKKCLRCGEITVAQVKLPKYDHRIDGVGEQYTVKVEVEKSCEGAGRVGYISNECYYCDAAVITDFELIPEHVYPDAWTKQNVSCEVNGFEFKDCDCGARLVKEGSVVEATGHKNKAGTYFEATCSYVEGFDNKCTNAHCDYPTKIVPVKHNYEMQPEVGDPCTGEFYNLYVCADCGHKKVDGVEKKDPKHEFEFYKEVVAVADATEVKAGETLEKCKNCGFINPVYTPYGGIRIKTEIKNLTNPGAHFVEGTKKIQVIVYLRCDKKEFHNFNATVTYDKSALVYKSSGSKVVSELSGATISGQIHKPDDGKLNITAFVANNAEGEVTNVALTGEWQEFIVLEFSVQSEVFKGKTDKVLNPEINFNYVGKLYDDSEYKSYFFDFDGNGVICTKDNFQKLATPIYRLGDANNDGVVNSADFAAIQQLILTDGYMAEADLDGDGEVKAKDLNYLQRLIVGEKTIKDIADVRK